MRGNDRGIDRDEPDELEPEGEMPVELVTERVRIYGAEVAGGRRGADEDPGEPAEGSLEEHYLGFSPPQADDRDWLSRPRTPGSTEDALEPGSHQELPLYLPGEPSGSVPVMPHWTDPPTGQVPAVVARRDDRQELWGSGGPSWRQHDQDWEEGGFEPSFLGDESTRVGALDETPLSERRPWEFGDLSSSGELDPVGPDAAPGADPLSEHGPRSSVRYDSDEQDNSEGSWWEDEEDPNRGFWEDEAGGTSAFGVEGRIEHPVPARVAGMVSEDPTGHESGTDESSFVASISSSPLRSAPGRMSHASSTRRHRKRPARASESTGGPGRNVPIAIVSGFGFALFAVICFWLGSLVTLVMSTIVVTLAAAECYAALRKAGHRPATLLGLVATVGLMVSVYAKGAPAFALVLALFVVTAMIWYLAGAEKGSPVDGITSTVLGFVWVGVLGSFSALMLAPSQYPHGHGVAFFAGAAVGTVAYDIGALALGGWLGRHPLAARVSPRKTWEGVIGGAILALAASVGITGQIHPWTPGKAAVLGLVVAAVAPIGDLCESLVKRDLGLKDMGSLLPGHGGFLDRVDALLFVLPATYYLVRVLHLG